MPTFDLSVQQTLGITVERATLYDTTIIISDNGTLSYEHCADVTRHDKCLGLAEERPAYRETSCLERPSRQRLAYPASSTRRKLSLASVTVS
ncbi:hypothetical protein [Sphingomonas sp. HMP9]|uniref:hypothetical protein n=1 Tax=Sphingomonas sp. HMP9 TaxID=1517554 RepID=UPI001E3EAFC5|nr:hypothetical protein [Sphingomonas sp. HMP9]